MSCSICLSLTFHFKFIHVAVNHKNFLLFYGLVVFHSIYIYISRQPRGATLGRTSGAVAERNYCGLEVGAVAERSYSMPEVRSSGCTLLEQA